MKVNFRAILLLSGFAFFSSHLNAAADYTIKISASGADTHASVMGVNLFKKSVEAKSKGKIAVEIYPNSQLGSERQAIEGLGIGTLEMAVVGGGSLLTLDDRLSFMDMPFLFKNSELAYQAYAKFLTDEINRIIMSKNLRALYITELGFRHITNSRNAIHKPEDLKGIKLRTMENPMHIEIFKRLSARPTPISFGELYTALQQGTVDGQENPISVIATAKLNEVQNFLSLTGHVYTTSVVLISNSFFNELPKALQTIVLEAAAEAKPYANQLSLDQNKDLLAVMQKKGITVNGLTDVERQVFMNQLKPVYDKYIAKHGDALIKKIRALE